MDVQVRGKVGLLRRVVEELREKTWELDTNKRNNLVLYGVREEASPGNTEWAVREVSNIQLETNVHNVVTISVKAHTGSYSWLKAPTSAFTIKTNANQLEKLEAAKAA